MGLLDGVAFEKENQPVQTTGCMACLEKDDRYPHTCNKGANNMTKDEQVAIEKLVDNNKGRPEDLKGCDLFCQNVPCHLCPVNYDTEITLGEIRAMDKRQSKDKEPEVTPTDDQPSAEAHNGERVCNCEKDYDTSDGHALDCAIHGNSSTTESIEGVTKPSHYMLFDDIEAIEVIARSMTREQFKGYCFGNILKYRLRAGKKSELAYLEKDMAKAGFYGELYEKHKDKCYDAW